jgi:hypothetical protein
LQIFFLEYRDMYLAKFLHTRRHIDLIIDLIFVT